MQRKSTATWSSSALVRPASGPRPSRRGQAPTSNARTRIRCLSLRRGWLELQEWRWYPALLQAAGCLDADVVKVEDRIRLIELDLDLGAARHGTGHVQPLVAVIQQDRGLDELALVHAVDQCFIAAPGRGNTTLAWVGVVRERQLGHVGVSLDRGLQ